MLSYHPPWRDMRFVIEELLELPRQWSWLVQLTSAT